MVRPAEPTTAAHLAESGVLFVSPKTVYTQLAPELGKNGCYAAIARGELPSVRMGGRIFVPVGALLRLAGFDGGGKS